MTLLLIGALTWYAGPYVGQPLRCGDVYDTSHEWIAIDIDALPGWECGDLVRVAVGDDVRLWRIRDSGPLSRYGILDGDTMIPIVADIPYHQWEWDGLSVLGQVENVTAGLRAEMEQYR